jgi:hypothetical protein
MTKARPGTGLYAQPNMRDYHVRAPLGSGFYFDSVNPTPTPDPAQDLVTYFGDDLVYFLDPANTTTMFKENATSATPITAVTTNADPVGLFYDRGYHGFYSTAESDATRPTLGSDATQKSYITFTATANSRFRVINSQSYLRKFSEASSTWCIATRIKMGAATDGTTNYLLMSHANSTANFGLRLLRFTDNKWNLWIVYGSAGNQRCLISFDKTQVVADGWVDIIIYANGANGTAIIGSTTQNFTLTSGATGNATNDLRIGSAHDGTSPFKGDMGYFMILNRIPTADEITTLKAYNPDRNTNYWAPTTPTWSLNFNNSTRGWADTGKTVAITNNTALRAWEPEIASIFGPLNRDATTASAGVSPIFKTAIQNGKAVIDFDGVDDALGLASSVFRERAGVGVVVMVVKNRRAALGSHVLFGSTYVVATGSTYPGGILGVGNTYFTVHPAAGPGIGPAEFENKTEGWNVIVFQRNGGSWTFYTGLKVKNTATDSNLFVATSMGPAAIVGWEADMQVGKIDCYPGAKADSVLTGLIDAEKASYAI